MVLLRQICNQNDEDNCPTDAGCGRFYCHTRVSSDPNGEGCWTRCKCSGYCFRDLEDSDSTSDITDTDIEDEDGIELDITEDAVDEDRSNMAKASIRYRFFSTQKSFYDAELFCQDRLPHGHLAALTSLSINNQLANLVCHQHGQCTRTFVGGERLQGNRFKWTDGSPWRFTNWMLGEPNNSGSDENCIEIFHNGDRRWNDINCRDKKSFICSYRA
ncbi:lectin-like isoform X2 [Huso huso]|uniref:Lectin-like isoform X2 n=1 Tax=Huso huso TaxID=61971 RepID=A0ABR0ZPM6_HUSHU